MTSGTAPVYVHATAIVIDGHGILISGCSKAGKSTLAEALIAAARADGLEALLIGDDRVGLRLEEQRLLVSPHPAIAGLIERRGTGIVAVPHQGQAQVSFEIALSGEGEPQTVRVERLPGAFIPALVIPPRTEASALLPLVLAALPQ
jgi:HPr kinase/phosphorylase